MFLDLASTATRGLHALGFMICSVAFQTRITDGQIFDKCFLYINDFAECPPVAWRCFHQRKASIAIIVRNSMHDGQGVHLFESVTTVVYQQKEATPHYS